MDFWIHVVLAASAVLGSGASGILVQLLAYRRQGLHGSSNPYKAYISVDFMVLAVVSICLSARHHTSARELSNQEYSTNLDFDINMNLVGSTTSKRCQPALCGSGEHQQSSCLHGPFEVRNACVESRGPWGKIGYLLAGSVRVICC